MGVIKHFSSSNYDTKIVERIVEINTNPDPKKYKILRNLVNGEYLILLVHYPDCTNYEGKKILVFEKATLKDLKEQGSIDPHFSNNTDKHSPIARFEPTERGWEFACLFVYLLNKRVLSS